jgi:hypothetical protein
MLHLERWLFGVVDVGRCVLCAGFFSYASRGAVLALLPPETEGLETAGHGVVWVCRYLAVARGVRDKNKVESRRRMVDAVCGLCRALGEGMDSKRKI